MNSYNIEKCPECGSEKIRETKKEIYCTNCGLVIEESPFAFEDDDSVFSEDFKDTKSRFGKPLEYLDGCGGSMLPPTLIGNKYDRI